MVNYKKLGHSIRTMRKTNELTIYELAILTDIDHDDLSDYERGVRPPTTRALISLLNYFQITFSECLNENENLEKIFLSNQISNLLKEFSTNKDLVFISDTINTFLF